MDPASTAAIAVVVAVALVGSVAWRVARSVRSTVDEACGSAGRGAFWTALCLVGVFATGLLGTLAALWWALDGPSSVSGFVRRPDADVHAKLAALLGGGLVQLVAGRPGAGAVELAPAIAAYRGGLAGCLAAVCVIAAVLLGRVPRAPARA